MINQNRLIKTFLDLVRIDSPTSREKEVGDFVLGILQKQRIQVERDGAGNIIARLSGFGTPLFLNAHLDTVQPGEGINPRIENGIIRSDGTTILGADNKAAVAAIIEALRMLKGNATHDLEIVFTVSEESKNLGALNLDYSCLASRHGFCFDCGEKLGTVILGSPFYDRVDIKIQGRASHAAHPEKGINALKIASQTINKLKLGKLDEFTVFNIGIIKGGSVRNTIPGAIRIAGELRSFREENLQQHEREIRGSFESACSSAGAKAKVKIIRENDGYDFRKSDFWVKKTSEILQAHNLRVEYKRAWTCSDANIFNQKGIRVLNLGDGVKNLHTCKESIKVKDLLALTKLIVGLVENFDCD